MEKINVLQTWLWEILLAAPWKKFHGKMNEEIPGFQSSGLNKHKDVSNVASGMLCESPSHMG